MIDLPAKPRGSPRRLADSSDLADLTELADLIDQVDQAALEEPVRSGGPRMRPTPSEAAQRRRGWLVAGAITVLAAGLRLYQLHRAYDIFIDEVTYTQIARNLASGHGLSLYGQPFYLHPPVGFLVLAAGVKVLGAQGPVDQALLHLRLVTALVGSAICGLTYLLLRRLDAPRAALAAGLIVAVDPFILQYDSQVMLESLAQLAVVSTIGLIVAALTTEDLLRRRWCLAGAGLCAALAMSTKETFGLVVGVLLVAMWATGWILARRQAWRLLVGAVGGYLVITLSGALLWGGLGPWWDDKVHGIERLVGLAQDTGFNAPTTHVTLASRLTANLAVFGTTYLLLFLGGLATLGLLRGLKPWGDDWGTRATPHDRAVLAVVGWAFVASGYLGYAIAFGSLEEQMFYIMALPVIAGLCLWVEVRSPDWRRVTRLLAAGALAAVLVVNVAIWTSVRTRPDDTYEQFLVWERANLPPGSVVSVTEFTGQFMVDNARLGQWPTLAEMRDHHVDYVLVATTLVEQGYGLGTPATLAYLQSHAPVVFQAHSRDGGRLVLFDVRGLTGGSGR